NGFARLQQVRRFWHSGAEGYRFEPYRAYQLTGVAPSFLRGDARVERLRPRLGIRAAGLAVHERIRLPLLPTRQLLVDPHEPGVGAEQDVTGKTRNGRDAAAETLHDRGMARVAGVSEPGSGDGSDAVGVDDVDASRALTGAPGPGRAARGMASRQLRGDGQRPHA